MHLYNSSNEETTAEQLNDMRHQISCAQSSLDSLMQEMTRLMDRSRYYGERPDLATLINLAEKIMYLQKILR